MFDGNLTTETIAWIAENVTAPLYADPVSSAKADRLKPALSKLQAFKPNELEAKSMTGESTSMFAAEALLNAGVKRVFVSLGPDGIVAAEDAEIVKLPCEKVDAVNTTGCGDAATAAIIWAGVQGLDHVSAAAAAMKASALTIECPQTVNPELSAELLV